jgi:hypothetical protein
MSSVYNILKSTTLESNMSLHGMHMDCTKSVAIFISGVLASSMVHTLMVISPRTQASIHAVFVCINTCTWSNGLFDAWLDGFLLHVRKHVDDDLPTPLYHAKDWWPLSVQCATATLAFASVATPCSPLVLYHFRLSFMACNHLHFVALHLV